MTAQRLLLDTGNLNMFHQSIGSLTLLDDYRRWRDRVFIDELFKSESRGASSDTQGGYYYPNTKTKSNSTTLNSYSATEYASERFKFNVKTDLLEVVKSLRKYRRTLKGDNKEELTKSIENLIDAYSLHLDDCIKSIYWLSKYEYPLKQMSFNEMDLKKIHSVKNYNERLELVDILCKYWEADLDLKTTTYSKENMDNKLYRRSSPQIISKMVDRLGITNVDGAYYKLSDDIKKDLYAYTASFIDSDGYITIDKNYNPRVGLVATGDRGKAFMIQIQKELGIGKLHLDQKSPQGTRPVNRLNFYSQGDVHELLTKCRPHFRMKGKNADLLLELVRMKKSYKKADWYKQRCEEIFKLMKYENHKDHVGYDFTKYGIDFETVAKLHDNCKMGTMDDLEGILKEDDVNEAIDELEEVAEEFDLSEHDWSSVDDASDYLFEHKVLDEEE